MFQQPRQPRGELLESREMLDGSAEIIREFNQPIYSAGLGDELFFTALDSGLNRQLWKSDGTSSGTTWFRKISLGSSSDPKVFGATDTHVFFTTTDNQQRHLWATDGTTNGRLRLLTKDIDPFDDDDFAPLGSKMLFVHQGALWVSNGNESGTSKVDTNGPVGAVRLTVTANDVYFIDSNGQLWKSDGTSEGTSIVSPVPEDTLPSTLTGAGSNVFFASGETRQQLWHADLDGDSHNVVFDDASIPEMVAVDEILFFLADQGTFSAGNRGLWRTDGTEAGTFLVHDLGTNYPDHYTVVGSQLFYTVGNALWRSDGTVVGTREVAEINSSFSIPKESNGDLYFSMATPEAGKELWLVHGDHVSTLDIDPGDKGSYPAVIGAADDKVLFWAYDTENSAYELWVTNGSAVGAQRIDAEITTRLPGASVGPITPIEDGFVFVADNDLWFSDGSPGTTHRIQTQYHPDNGRPFSFAGKAFFVNGEFEIWVTDGSNSGTQPFVVPGFGHLALGKPEFIVSNDTLYFEAWSEKTTQWHLWASDGTTLGTRIVHDFADNHLQGLVDSDGTLFFADDDALWKTNGTTDSTERIAALPNSMQPRRLVSNHGMVLISSGNSVLVSDGTETGTRKVLTLEGMVVGSAALRPTDGRTFVAVKNELWSTDGSIKGTRKVADGVTASFDDDQGDGSSVLGDRLIFENDAGELWVSDGTEVGTNLLGRFNSRYAPFVITTVEDKVYFFAGFELWLTDGTEGGTRFVANSPTDHFDGRRSDNYEVVDGELYFNEGHANELWRSDGTESGTMRITDLEVGSGINPAKYITRVDGHVYFRGDDGFNGQELWRVPIVATEPLPGDADGSGTVDFADFLVLSANFGRTEDVALADGDFDEDGRVVFADYLILAENFGESRQSVVASPGAGVTVTPNAGLQTSEEGNTDGLMVVLDAQPIAPVTIDVTSTNPAEGEILGEAMGVLTLNFDATNWDIPQLVRIRGVDEAVRDGDQSYAIVLDPLSTGDPNYDALTSVFVSATNVDDELPPLIYVWDIDFEPGPEHGTSIEFRVVVDVRHDSDEDGTAGASDASAAGVLVTVEFIHASGNLETLTGTTDSDGIFRSIWRKVRLPVSDGQLAEVVDLVLAGFAWDLFDILDPTSNDNDDDGDGLPDDLLSI